MYWLENDFFYLRIINAFMMFRMVVHPVLPRIFAAYWKKSKFFEYFTEFLNLDEVAKCRTKKQQKKRVTL